MRDDYDNDLEHNDPPPNHERIWLTTELGEVNWCQDRITKNDREYVRADLYERANENYLEQAQISERLNGELEAVKSEQMRQRAVRAIENARKLPVYPTIRQMIECFSTAASAWDDGRDTDDEDYTDDPAMDLLVFQMKQIKALFSICITPPQDAGKVDDHVWAVVGEDGEDGEECYLDLLKRVWTKELGFASLLKREHAESLASENGAIVREMHPAILRLTAYGPPASGGVDLRLNSDAVTAARGYLGDTDAEYLLDELTDIVNALLQDTAKEPTCPDCGKSWSVGRETDCPNEFHALENKPYTTKESGR